ncbi:MAG: FAD-dependent oxidoreductase [Saprospiraceae bacterium]
MKQDFSIWEYEAYHTHWDVCIIGGGITGLSTGISILERRPHTKVLVIDRWFIPLGASTRNAGFASFGSPSEILDDIRTMGEQASVSLISKRWKGLQKLKSRINLSTAQFEVNGGYELYHKDEFEQIAESLPYLNKILKDAIEYEDVFRPIEIPEGIKGFTHAIFNPHEGQLHPGCMMEHLKYLYLALGGKLWTGLDVEAIEETSEGVFLNNKLAIPVKADKVVVTINAFAQRLLPDIDVHGARNHVLVTGPIEGLKWKGCYHFDKGYYYFRNIGNRILLGGGRNKDLINEETDQFGSNPLIVSALEEFLYTHLTSREMGKIEFQWSGIIGIGTMKSPIIKPVSSRMYVGVRLSGMGIALASLIGEELADMILQQEEG